jgi:protocatechuate 3,4-dioxygenase beta subunit
MSFLRARRNNRPAPPTRRARFRLDALEARDVPTTLSGHVWFDQNNDGVRGPNETPKFNVPLVVSGYESESGNNTWVQRTTRTDANGLYQFTGLEQGTYKVQVGGALGYMPGKATAGAFGGTVIYDGVSDIPLPGGEQEAGGYNIPLVELVAQPSESKLSGLVWFDENNDGLRDPSEPPHANVQVALTGPDNTGESVTVFATTDANGLYRFTILEAGYYSVKVGSVPGYQPGKVSAGVFGGTVSGDQVSQIYVPTRYQNSGGYNFAMVKSVAPQPPGNTLSGLAWHDQDNDGTRDLNEKALANVAVTLTGTEAGTNNAVSRTATTDANGIYRFTGLNQGTYKVQLGQVSGYVPGKASAGAFGGTPSGGTVSDIPLPGGWPVSGGYNFGLVKDPPGNTLSGLVWNDLDNDGTRDLNETSLANVKVAIAGTEAATGNFVYLEAATDANGVYRFTGLNQGTYTVRVGAVSGYTPGKASAGAFGGTVIQDGVTAIHLPGGWQVSGGYNIGLVETEPNTPPEAPGNSISGHVWDDLDNDGIRDPNERPLPFVKLLLSGIGPTSVFYEYAETDANGLYRFTGLKQGTYKVTVAHADGYKAGKTSAGAFGGTPVEGTGVQDIPLPGGWQVSGGYNFGMVEYEPPPPPEGNRLSGYVWDDLDNDGTRDPDENPLVSVEVSLRGTVSAVNRYVELRTWTDATGRYEFDNISAGQYSIVVPMLPGYKPGTATAGSLGGTPHIGLPPHGVASVGVIYLSYFPAQSDGYNFGMVQYEAPGSRISGYVYRDDNNNNVRDPNELLVSGVEMTLTGNVAGTNQSVYLTVRSDLNGMYQFFGLSQGTYSIRSEWAGSRPWQNPVGTGSVGAFGGTPGLGEVTGIVVPGGNAESDGYDFSRPPLA